MQHTYHFLRAPAIVVGTCGHGLAIMRALHAGQVPLLALEANLDQPGAHTRLAPVERVSKVDAPDVVEALLALRPRIEAPGRPVLFLTNDTLVRGFAAYWELVAPYYRLSWAHCRKQIARLLDKHHLEEHCRQQGSAYPPTFLLRSDADIDAAISVVGAPSIVKPAKPLAGFKTALPKDRDDFARLIARFRDNLPFLVQRFIPGDDTRIHFCALYLEHGRVLARFDGHKLRSRPMGHTTIAESDPQHDVYAETIRFFEGLGLSGPVSLELKRDSSGKLWVIEPTVGRTDFWLGLCTANGVNLPLIEYRNQVAEAQPASLQQNCAVWFNEERDPLGRLWLASQPDLSLRGRRAVYLYLHRNDPAPALKSLARTGVTMMNAVPRRLFKLVAGDTNRTPTREAALIRTVEIYANPREFPPDVIGLFAQTEECDIESGPSWYTNYVDTVVKEPAQAQFYVLRREGRAVAALPMVLVRKWLGCEVNSLSNFYTSLFMPVLASDADSDDLSVLLQNIWQRHPDLRCLYFAPLDPHAPSTKMLVAALRDRGLIDFDYFCFNNWYLRISRDWEAYLASREGMLRSTLKRMDAKLRAQGGSLEIVTGGAELEAALADYERVYQASWKRSEPFVHFIPGLVHAAARNGWLRLGITRLRGRAIAAQIWLVHRGRACIFKLAYDESYRAFSPGTLLTAYLLQYVWEVDRVRLVDYLIGDDAYKKSWMSDSRERIGIVAYNPRSLFGLLGAGRELLASRSKALRRRMRPWRPPRQQNLAGGTREATVLIKCA